VCEVYRCKANISSSIYKGSRGEGKIEIILILQENLFEGIFIGKLVSNIDITLIPARSVATGFFNNSFLKEA